MRFMQSGGTFSRSMVKDSRVHVLGLDSQEGRVVLGASLGCVKGFRSVASRP
jgi:hypothetical protein